jgi:transposase
MADGVVEVITGRERRRRWSMEDKLRIVSETLEPGASVSQVAARHDVYPGLLFIWRRQVREGKLVPQPKHLFLPIQTQAADAPASPVHPDRPAAAVRRQIEIELRDGSRIRVDEDVGLAGLRRVLTALRG